MPATHQHERSRRHDPSTRGPQPDVARTAWNTRRRVTLYRGVYPVAFDVMHTLPEILYPSIFRVLLELGLCTVGDRIIVTKGEYSGVQGGTNSMKILEVRI